MSLTSSELQSALLTAVASALGTYSEQNSIKTTIQFTNQNTKNALTDVISSAIKESHKDPSATEKSMIDGLKTLNSTLETANKTISDSSSSLEKVTKDTANALKNTRNDAEEKVKDALTWYEKAGKYMRIASDAFNVASSAVGKTSELYKDSISTVTERLNQLGEAGVYLKEGYDKTISEFSDEVGLTRDDFTKLLATNSKFIKQFNAVNEDGIVKIKNAYNSMRGYLGTNAKETDAIMKHYNENILLFADSSSERYKNYEDQLISQTKLFKALSYATGKSVEQLTKENEIRGKHVLHQQLATREDTKDMYALLKAIGTSDAVIENMLLGKASTEATMTYGGAAGAEYQSLARAVGMARRYGLKNMDEIMPFLGPYINRLANKTAYVNRTADIEGLAYAFSNQDSAFTKMNMPSIIGRVDSEAVKKALGSPETDIARQMIDANKAEARYKNALENILVPSINDLGKKIDTLKTGFDIASKSVKTFTNTLDSIGIDSGMRTNISAGAVVASSLFGSALGGALLGKTTNLFGKIVGGIFKSGGKTSVVKDAVAKSLPKTTSKSASLLRSITNLLSRAKSNPAPFLKMGGKLTAIGGTTYGVYKASERIAEIQEKGLGKTYSDIDKMLRNEDGFGLIGHALNPMNLGPVMQEAFSRYIVRPLGDSITGRDSSNYVDKSLSIQGATKRINPSVEMIDKISNNIKIEDNLGSVVENTEEGVSLLKRIADGIDGLNRQGLQLSNIPMQ